MRATSRGLVTSNICSAHKNKNRVLTRTMISEKIWDIDFITESNIVDVYINFLRAKVDKGHDKKIIRTVRGVGYIVKEVL